jgi:polysaccharide pyruvyl transferase CsaB
MRVLILGYHGFGNVGDEALLLSLLQMLPASAEPVVLSPHPDITAESYSVQVCPRWHPVKVAQQLGTAQALIWGGGSLLQDATSWRSPLYYLALMAAAQRLNLITLAWAQGIGPLSRPWIRSWVRQVLAHCTQISVRDDKAASLLDAWQVPYTLAPDPVWCLSSQPPNLAEPPKHPAIAVILREHPLLTEERQQLLLRALRILQQTTESTLWLVPFQLDPVTEKGADLTLARTLYQGLMANAQILCLRDPRELKGLLGQARLVISMRYHGLIMAAASGCRCFGLSYDPKVTTLMQSLQMPYWELDQIPADSQQISEAWVNCYHSKGGLASEQIQQWQQRSQTHARLLEQLQ